MPKTVRPRRIVQPAAADAWYPDRYRSRSRPKRVFAAYCGYGFMEKRRLGSKNWISTDPRLRERLPLRLPTLPLQVAISGSLPRRLAAEERTAPSWSADRQPSH